MIIRAIIIVMVTLLGAVALAQAPAMPPMVPGVGLMVPRGGGGSGPTPPVACSAGQLVFSDACNTTLYMVILR